jgi:uncharacterized SAM-binding protein YcdF (DUF218 family)
MRKPTKRFLIFGSVLLIWVTLAAVAGNFLVVEVPIERADVIVVLSGSAEYRNRAHTAAQLFRQHVAPAILVTDDGRQGGWDQGLQRNPAYFELIKRSLESEGVPPEHIYNIPGVVDGTYEEALVITRYLSDKNIRSALLVTSGFHTRRTISVVRRAAETDRSEFNFGITCPEIDKQFSAKAFWWLRVSGWRNIPAEVIKLIYYRWEYLS